MLALVRSLFEAADPVPAGLVERVRFSVALAGLEGEVARLTAGDAELSQLGDRGQPDEYATGSRWRVARPRRAARSRSTAAT